VVKQEQPTVVDAISKATQADIDAIDATICDLKEAMKRSSDSISSLKVIRRAIDQRINGKKPRQVRVKKAAKGSDETSHAPPDGTQLAQEVYDLLFHEGSMPVPAIAERLGRTAAAVGNCTARSDWFEKQNGEVRIRKS
jgi:hypothetical protein